MKKIFFFLFLMQCLFFNCLSQVNYQNGSAVFGIPILDWKENISLLNLNVSLNYSSGNGLKVNDVASNVGQGWNLMAGGSITRMQVGEPDDQKPYHQYNVETWDDTKKYPAGYLYSQFDVTKGVSSSINQYPIFQAKNILYKQFNDVAVDKELDRFSFEFNGKTGIFILNGNTKTGEPLEYDNRMKISFTTNENNVNNQIRTTIVAFNILDEGIIYKFTKFNKTKLLKSSFCLPDLINKLMQPTFENDKVYHENLYEDASIINPYVINEWMLEEIEDAFTHRKINFSYITRNINVQAGSSPTHYDELNQKNYSIVSHQKSVTQSFDLSGITMPDGYEILLSYGNERVDFKGQYALASIGTKYLGRWVSKFLLKTNYFIKNRIGNPKSEFQNASARLCLQSVTKLGPDLKAQDEPYVFDYYVGSNVEDDYVPAPFTFFKDIWGFYNGNNSKDFNNNPISLIKSNTQFSNTEVKGLCYKRNNSSNVALNAKAGYAKNGLLKQIIYPSGGSLKFEYEQNEAIIEGQAVSSFVGGVHVAKTLVTDGGYNNGCNNPLVNNYKYINENSTQSSLWGIELPKNDITVSTYYKPAEKKVKYKPLFNFTCKYNYQYPGIAAREHGFDLTGHQKFMQTLSVVLDVITAVSQIIDVINVCLASTGVGAIIALIIDIIFSIVGFLVTCVFDNNPEKTSTSTMFYNADVNGVNPLPSMFKRVEITESGGSTNGKTIMEFTSRDDYPIWHPTNPTFSMKQRYATWAYGLPKRVLILDNTGNKIKETINEYQFIKNNTILFNNVDYGTELYPNIKYLIKKNISQRSDYWLNENNYKYPESYINISNDNIIIEKYLIFFGKTFLTKSTEKNFNQLDNTKFKTKITNNYYSPCAACGDFGLIDSIKYINNDGTSNTTKIDFSFRSYSYENKTSIFYLLNSSNFYKNNKIIYSDLIFYKTMTNGLYSPFKTGTTRYNIPNEANPSSVETQFFTFDPVGSLIGQKDEGNRNITNIYDYNNKFAVATVINAEANVDKTAYTSFETTSLGGWTYSASSPSYITNAVTGARALQLSSGTQISTYYSSTKPYKISFWATNVLTLPAFATLVKNSPTINGFTYYEYNLAQGNNNLTISGNGIIDELRLSPLTSRMRTTTYDPIIGKTSECDENNRITYYEYDDLGRMRFIKDDRKNIVKMYEYNVAKKSVCPVTYTNFAVSEVFTKNNCSSGFEGTNVIYTIPAGKYTSTYSQEAVDAQVDKELAESGQIYANSNGTCIPVYYNTDVRQDFFKEDCPVGYKPTPYSYIVIVGSIKSYISQADANAQAQQIIDANGQALANASAESISCEIDYDPVYEGTGATQCLNGQYQIQVIDINPNSNNYNQVHWANSNDPCPPGTPVGSTNVYVRMEVDNLYNYSDQYYSVSYGNLVHRFYSDQSCTAPLSLSFALGVTYRYTSVNGSEYGSNSYDYFETATSVIGDTEYPYGEVYFYENYSNGDGSYYYQNTNYSLVAGSGYTVVQ